MTNTKYLSGGLLIAAVLTVSGTAILADTPATHSPQAVVGAFSRMIESHQALEGVKEYVAADFVEHDASVTGGDREGMIRYLTDHGWTQPSAVKSDIHIDRIIASGEFVVVHQHLRRAADQPVLVFVDIFRVRDGKIVEHWDVNQAVPQSPANTKYTMY
jgi:predicted SnoaL-like aldol condensation-catalyzing enzyme